MAENMQNKAHVRRNGKSPATDRDASFGHSSFQFVLTSLGLQSWHAWSFIDSFFLGDSLNESHDAVTK